MDYCLFIVIFSSPPLYSAQCFRTPEARSEYITNYNLAHPKIQWLCQFVNRDELAAYYSEVLYK
jgi:hypothetical protein